MQTETTDKNTEELLRQLLAWQKKETRRARLASLFNILLVLGILAALFLMAPRVLKLADRVEASMAEVNRMTASAQELIGNADVIRKLRP